MGSVTLDNARLLTAALVKAIDPQSIIVFGGVGRDGAGNDLDLLIVLEDGSGKSIDQAGSAVRPVLRSFSRKFEIDPFIMSSSLFKMQFQKGSPFLKTVVREGRLLYLKNAEQEWLNDAREELKTAHYLSKGRFWKAACYHSQQAAEKCLKARLLGKGWELEKVQSLARLAALLEDFKIKIQISDDEVEYLDSIHRGRYPGEAGLLPLGEPSREDAMKALDIAEKLLGNI